MNKCYKIIDYFGYINAVVKDLEQKFGVLVYKFETAY